SSRRFLSPSTRQNRRSEKSPRHRSSRPPERADLLLQHGMLRSPARQRPRCRSESPDQLQDGQLLSRPREEGPRPESPSRSDLKLLFVRLRSAVNHERLAQLFRENFERYGELGAAVSVWRHGKSI